MTEITSSPEATNSNETLQPYKKQLLIFGQGPVLPSMDAEGNLFGEGTIWLNNEAEAAAKLYAKYKKEMQIIILGGKTGGDDLPAEAEVLQQKLEDLGVDSEDILPEKSSNDTISNLINFINEYWKNGQAVDIMGGYYHTPRIQIIMQLLQVPFANVFKAESLLDYFVGERLDSSSRDMVIRLTGMLNTNEQTYLQKELVRYETNKRMGKTGDPTQSLLNVKPEGNEEQSDSPKTEKGISFYEKQKSPNNQDLAFRMVREDVLIRELLERPESWIGRVAEIKSFTQRKKILEHAQKIYPGLLERYGIDLSNDGQTVEKLRRIEKVKLSDDESVEWMKESMRGYWPPEVKNRYELLLAERQTGLLQ